MIAVTNFGIQPTLKLLFGQARVLVELQFRCQELGHSPCIATSCLAMLTRASPEGTECNIPYSSYS